VTAGKETIVVELNLSAKVEFDIGSIVILDVDQAESNPKVYRVGAHLLRQSIDANGDRRIDAMAILEGKGDYGSSDVKRTEVTAARLRPVPAKKT